jgi:hypothetical protein
MTSERADRLRQAADAAKAAYCLELEKAGQYADRINKGDFPSDAMLEKSLTAIKQRHDVWRQSLDNYVDALGKLTDAEAKTCARLWLETNPVEKGA